MCKTGQMKPSFALDFRDGTISLLHRTSRGWQQVGASPLDAPDLADALTYLRSTALGLSPRGLSTKLVLPNEMILYTQVHAPGPDVAKRRRQIKAGLEGLTPYKVDDLVFDWWGSGTEVHVAVVARETLAEAEAFAIEHRFNPVSFVGAPENGSYMGEPFFGPSALSATLLAEGEKVERDQDPVSVLAREFGKSPTPDAAAKPTVEAVAATAMLASDSAVVDKGEDPAVMSPPLGPTAPTAKVASSPSATDPAPTISAPTISAPSIPVPTEKAVAADQPAPVQKRPDPIPAKDVPSLPDFGAVKARVQGVSTFDPAAMAIDLVDEAPMAVDVADDLPPPNVPPLEPPVSARTTEPPVKAAPLVAPVSALPNVVEAKAAAATFSDRPTPEKALPPSPSSAVIAAFASRRAGPVVAQVDTDRARKQPGLGPAPLQRPPVPRPAMAKPAAILPNSVREAVPFPTKAAQQGTKFTASKPGKPIGAASAAFPIKQRDRNVVPLPKQAIPATGDATATVTKPLAKGATGLDGRPVAVRGKPRYLGLILTALLLLALALVAAWSSYFLTSNEPDPNATPAATAVAAAAPDATASDPATVLDAATVPAADSITAMASLATAAQPITDATASAQSTVVIAPDASSTGTDTVPTAMDEAIADGQDPSTTDAAIVTTVAGPVADAVTAPVTEAAVVPATAAAPKPEPAPGTEITTEVARDSVQGNDPQDEIFLADADTPPQTSDPIVLPQLVAASDPAPDISAAPPPYGTLYTFDAEGRIKPTPEGIITPEGVLLIAGTPKVVPPTRPVQLTAPIDATAPVIAIAPDAGSTAATLATSSVPDSTAGTVATESSAGSTAAIALVAPDSGSTTATTLDSAAAGSTLTALPAAFPSDPALAGKRPKLRPAGLVDPGATTAKQGEALAPAADSRFAALRPQVRPAALNTAVTQAAAAAPAPDAELANGATAASLALNGVKPSALAVSVSRMPAARPGALSQAVNAAVAAAIQAPQPQQQTASVAVAAPAPQPQKLTASAAPEAQAEPDVENAAPSLPTNASVARQATTKDALNLSGVAVLGIFGTASGRYAMIRQPFGGVKKVVVGDSINGGRIAAITDTAIQYQKGGRMFTLALPAG